MRIDRGTQQQIATTDGDREETDMTEQDMREQMAIANTDLSDIALLISDGNDYDDMCQMAITEIAELLGITNETEEPSGDYEVLMTVVNEDVTAMLAEWQNC